MKQNSESNANQMALTSEKWRDRNGDFTGEPHKRVKPNLVLPKLLCYNLLKIKINKRWKYVYICLPSSFFFLPNVSGEVSPTPGLE